MLLLCPRASSATTVIPLSPSDRAARADAIVEGQVLTSRCERSRGAIVTRVTVRVDHWHKRPSGPGPGATITLLLPGGRLGDEWLIIVGMPDFQPGEVVRLFLEKHENHYLPLGLWQGVVRMGGPRDRIEAYKLNGFVWDASQLPVPYYLNERGSEDLGAETAALVQQSFATWEKVPCSTLRVTYKGTTPVEPGLLDKQNVLGWEEKSWAYGSMVAAAAAYGGKGDIAQADITFNGVNFTWTKGGASLFSPYVLDPASVITHEIGHILGLSHTETDNVATMAPAYVAGGVQATLTGDDKLGLCALYPASPPKNECQDDCGCPLGSTCRLFDAVKARLCDEVRSPDNTTCTEWSINCPGLCLFYDLDVTTKKAKGYCTQSCATDGQSCGASGWTCKQGTTHMGLGLLACTNPSPNPVGPVSPPRVCKDAGLADALPGPDGGLTEDPEASGCACGAMPGACSGGALGLLGAVVWLSRWRRQIVGRQGRKALGVKPAPDLRPRGQRRA